MQSIRTLSRASALATQQATMPLSRTFASTSIAMQRISELIKDGHKGLESSKNNILNATSTDERVRWQNQFSWELARHAVAEELVVYPAMERNCPGGQELTDRDRENHQKVKELLYKFQSLSPTDADFEPTLNTLWSELKHHIDEEEAEDLPLLEKHTTEEESEGLTASFMRTKLFIPTRSHPSAPNRPPFETVAGMLAAPIDRIGDLFRKFPKES